MSENNIDLNESEIVIECDSFITNMGDNQMDMNEIDADINTDYDQYLDQISKLILKNQRLTTQFHLDEHCLDENLIFQTQSKLTKTQIWKMQRIADNLNLLDKDCHQIFSFATSHQSIVQFNQIELEINEIINKLELIKRFDSNDDSIDDSFTHELAQNLNKLEDVEQENELIQLNKEMNQLKKELALLDVLILENESIEQLIADEGQLKAQIEHLKSQQMHLNQQVMALKSAKIIFASNQN